MGSVPFDIAKVGGIEISADWFFRQKKVGEIAGPPLQGFREGFMFSFEWFTT